MREELAAGEDLLVRGRQSEGSTPVGREQVLDRVDAEDRGEQRRDRRQAGDLVGDACGHALLLEAALSSCAGRLLASPAIISEKNTPIDSAVPEFWNVERIPEAAPRWRAGTLLMIEDELGALNMPDADPVERRSAARTPSRGSRPAAASGR